MTAIAIGVDLVRIDRMRRMVDRHGDRLLRRLLTDDEREYCIAKAHPAQHIAARVAAKEAAYKALQAANGARSVSWLDIAVRLDGEGRPSLEFTGRAARAATELGVVTPLVSLSHSLDTAAAFVVLVG